jgi:DNA-3-methyladenine glycosylase
MTPIRDADFFSRHVVHVAKDLIGKHLVYHHVNGIITETEAYGGGDDPASHAYLGLTPRNQVMYGPPGRVYVYFVYGMYYCLNIVTEEKGTPSAVLIRAIKIGDAHINGPGKICAHLGITKKEYGIDLLTHPDVYIAQGKELNPITATPRIGIKKATEKLWRFVAHP